MMFRLLQEQIEIQAAWHDSISQQLFKVKVGEADHYIKLHVTHNRELGLEHNSLEQAHVQEIVILNAGVVV